MAGTRPTWRCGLPYGWLAARFEALVAVVCVVAMFIALGVTVGKWFLG